MNQGEAVGMEHETGSSFWVVERISHDGMPMMREMDTDLMRSASLELALDQTRSFEDL